MVTSAAMNEIRAIRDEMSARHSMMSREEVRKELDRSVEWFLKETGKTREECVVART